MAESTLGMSSLDRLRELKEENERRQAVGRRQILELPIGDVHPDPHQVRTDFAADVVAADDHEDLEGLARNIAGFPCLSKASDEDRRQVMELVRERVPRTPSSSTSVAELGRLAHRAAQFFSDRERTP